MTLEICSKYGRPFATVRLFEGGLTIECREDVRDAIERLVMNDFDELIGFPPQRLRAKQGTAEALKSVGEYFRLSLGFQYKVIAR